MRTINLPRSQYRVFVTERRRSLFDRLLDACEAFYIAVDIGIKSLSFGLGVAI